METAEQHRKFVAEIDKKMKKLSLKIHSDKVNAGDDKQAALNACRSLIKNASEFFLDYIHADFKYEHYNKMKINSLGVINLLNVRFLAKLGPISRIKQEEIITYTHKFLKASRSSLEQFIKSRSCDGYSSDWAQYTFEQHRDDALNYLTSCIEGCEKFDSQCEEILEECRQDAKLHDLLYDSIFDMSYKNNKQLEQLYKLKEFANNALLGTIGIIEMREMDEYMALPFAMYVGALALCSNAPEGKKDDDISCIWWLVEKLFSCVPANMLFNVPSISFSSPFFSLDVGKKGENLNKVLINLASYLDVRKEISVSKFFDAIEIISNKLAENFDLNHYRPITVEFYLEESRELAERIERFTKKVAEDLAHARRILQDQEKIREGFAEVREGFAEVRNNQAELRGEMQDFRANFRAWAEQLQNPQPQPSGSLIDAKPSRHNKSMSRD
ncbi:Hypothetical protein CINCED_3A016923 [Cinara cedri]|uniref:Uncharacterized protein n=1 Tax=Cinara cedri TaxID=506608 RepID=A0A5E4MRU9_9HEMI|nr:Hypothetical protein CINCED_3A016923 [Cinara cedri]